MRQSFNVQFYCRDSKANKAGIAPLELSIIVNGDRKFVQLPFKCSPSDFNKKRQPKEIADYVANMRRRINQILADMVSNEEPLTTAKLSEYVRNGGYKSYTVENLFDDYLSIIQKRVGTTMCKSVYSKYELVKSLFLSIIDKNEECSHIKNAHVKEFQALCESKFKTSTTGGYMQKLKTFITFGIDNGKLTVNPFSGVKISKGENDIEYLTQDELDSIKNLKLNECLDNVRNFFLFECYSGISYCDIANLKVTDIQEDNGVYFIKKFRQKTGKEFTSVLLPQAKDLIVFDNQGVIVDFKFRIISNQKSNLFLNIIKNLSFIDKKLTTHIGRHTYATLLANKYKCRMETVASALGDSLKITQKHYAKFLSTTTIKEISSNF